MNMGRATSRLSRSLQLPIDAALSGSGSPGGPVPTLLDTSAVVPVWDAGQNGFLDPHPSDYVIPGSHYSTFVHHSGLISGHNNKSAIIVGPEGFVAPGNAISSVNNNVPSRQHNSVIQVVGGYIAFDALGAAAFNGKVIEVQLRMTQTDEFPYYSDFTVAWRDTDTVTSNRYYYYFAEQVRVFVPWDCAAWLQMETQDETDFPDATSMSFQHIVHVRNKNQAFPVW